jgi:5-methylcytosine-specific restriction endonuclease McrA
MKRSPLKRKTPIRRRAVPKHGAAQARQKPETSQQRRRKEELARRRKLKAELLLECPTDDQGRKLCPGCKKLPDFRGLSMHHVRFLSQGGVTLRDNVLILCYSCHNEKHGIKEVKY